MNVHRPSTRIYTCYQIFFSNQIYVHVIQLCNRSSTTWTYNFGEYKYTKTNELTDNHYHHHNIIIIMTTYHGTDLAIVHTHTQAHKVMNDWMNERMLIRSIWIVCTHWRIDWGWDETWMFHSRIYSLRNITNALSWW